MPSLDIGFIGLGVMGAPMATHLARAGHRLTLHDADPAGIGFYIDHHRIHVGTDETAADMAYQAWRADLAAGADSILLAPTNDVINELNARARADRLAADPGAARADTVVLRTTR